MEEWINCPLGEILNFRRGHDLPHTELAGGDIPVAGSNGIIGFHNEASPISPCITIGRSGNVGIPFMYNRAWAHNTTLYIDDFKGNDPLYIFYLLKTLPLSSFGGGSAVPTLNRNHIHPLIVKHCTNVSVQRRIASVLKSFDDKIEVNNRINHNLHNLAQELFNNNIVENACRSSGWRSASLLDIAEYLNGLAMQKYPAINGEFSLPVLKIKELGQQACDANSDRCTESIPEQFIVKDGDIIFSWSGTLLVDFWCGGKCGLNQHLFKVSSDMYPNWFVYFWTKHHLDRFIRIAKDKAVTMGHIKRGDLGKAVVVIPEDAVMNKLNGEIAPLISECIERRIENRKLQSLRNSLLPKLMSGELKINDLTC